MKSKLNFSLRSLIIIMILSLGLSSFSNALSIKDELNNAKKFRKTVFLIVTEKGLSAEKVKGVTKDAAKREKNSVVLTMFRDDITNNELVSKFGLAGAPLPIILVIASNGVVTGGLKDADATADALINLIPSPKHADVLQAMSEKKSIFVVVSKKSFLDKTKLIDKCKSTIPQLKNNVAIIEIDADDQNEQKFLKQIGATNIIASSVVVVANSQGQITGKFDNSTDANTLAAAATKVNKGCCGGGSSCAPKKK